MGITDYRLGFDPAVPGTIATALKSCDIRSKFNAETVPIAWGRAVVQGTVDDDVILPAANKTDLVGIAARTYMYETAATADGASGYPAKKQIDVLTSGDIWVEVEESVAPGDSVFFRIAASANTPALSVVGKFRTDADITDPGGADTPTAVEIPGARWIKGGSTVACLQINLP